VLYQMVKTIVLANRVTLLRDHMFWHNTDRRMGRRTNRHDDGIYRASTASCGKKNN